MNRVSNLLRNRRTVTAASVVAVLCALWLVEPDRMTLASGGSDIPSDYAMPFGKNPFAPGKATTATGTFIAAEKFISSDRCAECHQDTHAQWLQSAHRNAFREPFYQKNVKDIQNQKGIEFTRHCESCHNPAALFSGALTKGSAIKRPFDEEGVSCIACHSIQSVSNAGIGAYVMNEPALLEREDGTRLLDVTNDEIKADVPSHRRAMMRPVTRTSQFCAACHKSQVPKELNDYKFIRTFAVYDEYQMSSFSQESPHPYYKRDFESCQTCHMKPATIVKPDVSAKNDTIKAHRWAAANTAIPYYYGWQDQVDAVRAFLENNGVGVDIFALWRAREKDADEQIPLVAGQSFGVAAGETLTADVVVTNRNIGHSFPPELRDFYEAWVEFVVTDDAGRELYHSGYLKPNGYLDDSAHTYKTYLVDGNGQFIGTHEIWKIRAVAQNLQIPSGRSDIARYRFTVPADLKGGVRLTAKVQYRRFVRQFQDYALEKSVDYPIVTMTSASVALAIGQNSTAITTAQPALPPEWRRWNNYGIASFDARQFAVALDAFSRASALDEAYRPMAEINRALALFELDRFDEALDTINRVVAADPKNARATFQHGRIMLKRGRLDEARADFERVLAAYPRDRATMQQLGELYKQRRDFSNARTMFEAILGIDPEDTGAYYNLMLIYRKLGLKDDAARMERLFADQKDDPAAFARASAFLRANPLMSNETVPWHVHQLNR